MALSFSPVDLNIGIRISPALPLCSFLPAVNTDSSGARGVRRGDATFTILSFQAASGTLLRSQRRILQGIGGAMMVPVGAPRCATPKAGLTGAIASPGWP
jgi:hypothetical protein